MPGLSDLIAMVAGASRGAGKGIALALGDAGATVYVVGRTTSGGPRPPDGAPGSIDETAEEVTRRGGRGIPVRADCANESDVAALFARVEGEHGRLDLLANAVWGGSDGYSSVQESMASWGRPFWEEPAARWRHVMDGGPHAYYLMSRYALALMAPRRRGLIVGVTDFYMGTDGEPACRMGDGQLLWTVSHLCIDLLLKGMANEAKKVNVAVITLMPGFMRTERVERAMTSDEIKKQMGYDKSESTEYLGRAVAALAADRKARAKSGKILYVADLAEEYGFTDVDGRRIPRFNPFG